MLVESETVAAMTTEAILAEIRTASSVTELREATARAIEALTEEKQLTIRLAELESKVVVLEAKP